MSFFYFQNRRRKCDYNFVLWKFFTDSVENVAAIAKIVGKRADRWELCAFNNLCRSKYERLGADWPFRASPLMTRGEMEQLTAAARAADAENVCWTGRTAMEETI